MNIMKKMSRLFSLISVLLVLAMIFAGCSQSSGPVSDSSTPTTSSASGKNEQSSQVKPVTLTFRNWAASPEEKELWASRAAAVSQQYPEITLNIESTSFNDYWTKLSTEIATQSTPDILTIQNARVQTFGMAFEPMDSYIKADPNVDIEDFSKGALGMLQYNGSQIGLPYDQGGFFIYYNKDLFEKSGVPFPEQGWTWDDFLQTAKKLTKDGNYGYSLSTFFDHVAPIIFMHGADYLDESGKYDVNNDGMVSVIQKLSDFVAVDKISPALVATSDPLWDQEQWLVGNIGMMMTGPWKIMDFTKRATFKFAAVPLPEGPQKAVTTVMGTGFGLSKYSKNKEAAYKAVAALTSKDSIAAIAEAGRALPARISVMDSYYKLAPRDFEPTITRSLETAVTYRITPTWQQAGTILMEQLIPIFNGQAKVKEGLDHLQAQLELIEN